MNMSFVDRLNDAIDAEIHRRALDAWDYDADMAPFLRCAVDALANNDVERLSVAAVMACWLCPGPDRVSEAVALLDAAGFGEWAPDDLRAMLRGNEHYAELCKHLNSCPRGNDRDDDGWSMAAIAALAIEAGNHRGDPPPAGKRIIKRTRVRAKRC